MLSLLRRLAARLRPQRMQNGRVRREEAALRQLVQRLFPEEEPRGSRPLWRAEPPGATGRRIVHATRETVLCELLRRLAPAERRTVRKTADRIIVSVPAERKTVLTLTRYLCPIRKRWTASGAEEVLFARLSATCGSLTRPIADFYIAAESCCAGRLPSRHPAAPRKNADL